MDVLSILVACMTAGAQPTTERCTGRLVTASDTAAFSEQFTLSLNDPIEFFRYQSRYRPLGEGQGIFLLAPILGDIRDRFIDEDPFNDTLFFTSMIGGAGIEQAWGSVGAFADAGLIYLKQRYAGNFVHTDEEREPEMNRLYDFAQMAGATTAGLTVGRGWWSLAATYARIDLRSRGRIFAEQELNAEGRAYVWRGETASLGLYVQRYQRVSGLRRDGNEDGFALARGGVFGEF